MVDATSTTAIAGVESRRVEAPDPAEVRALYESAGWWEGGDRVDAIPEMVRGTFCFAGAFEGGRMIGMARVLSDGASDAYIQDVVVHPDARRRGVGAGLVAFLRDWCESAGIVWLGLIGEPGTGPFYERLGFRRMEGYVPMLYRPGRERSPG